MQEPTRKVGRNAVMVFAVVVLLIVGLFAAYTSLAPESSSSSISSSSSTASGGCLQPSGVEKAQLNATNFGEVTTYALPKPLKAPNSIASTSDGSVWFGEIGLRGVAHLFLNGTLLEYAWPASNFSPSEDCLDINALWGLEIWHGLVWATDYSNDQIVGLVPSNDTFHIIALAPGTLPRFLAIDQAGNLWFTSSSTTATEIGVLDSPTATPRYFDVPAGAGQISASIVIYNSSLAYVVTVNQSNASGEVFSFDPASPQPTFAEVGSNETLLAPYSAAVANGGIWVGEHDASDVAFLNQTSSQWSFYPTSVNPEVPLTLPYYLLANGSSVWFNEHDSNKIAELTGATSLTEFNISSSPLGSPVVGGVGNALTIGLDHDLVWFTEWTGNKVGFVNASISPAFSITSDANSTLTSVAPGSSASVPFTLTSATSANLTMQFADSESHNAMPVDLSFNSSMPYIDGLSGALSGALTISAKPGTPPGEYLVLLTVTDQITYRSVYIPVEVS